MNDDDDDDDQMMVMMVVIGRMRQHRITHAELHIDFYIFRLIKRNKSSAIIATTRD